MPVASPIAHTPSATRIRSSTGIPWRVGSTPTVSRPRPSTRARRPVATSRRSPRSSSRPANSTTYSSPSRRTPAGVLAEVELDPVRRERRAERVAERLRLARQHVVHALDERDRSAQAVHGLRHLDSDRAAAQHEQPARHLGQRGHLAVRPDAVQLAQAGDGRDHGVRPGRDHDVVRGVGLVADLDAARAGEPRRPAQHLDALSPRGRRPWPRPRSPPTMKSRHAKAPSGRTPPLTASRAPGASRAAWSASPGRSSVFDGMQAQ